jgi:hypothetical protein
LETGTPNQRRKSAAYEALSIDGQFSVWLQVAPDGMISWKYRPEMCRKRKQPENSVVFRESKVEHGILWNFTSWKSQFLVAFQQQNS